MDTNKKGFDWWCDRMWIKVGCCITGVIVVAMLINWQTWSPALKCVFAIAALIPLHVVEEWVFPGGFNSVSYTHLTLPTTPYV